jgi:hypothetical protein
MNLKVICCTLNFQILAYYLNSACMTSEVDNFRPKTNAHFKQLSEVDQVECVNLFQEFIHTSKQKLDYVLEKHPSYQLFNSVQVFDPRTRAAINTSKTTLVQSIPQLNNVTDVEWHRYLDVAKTAISVNNFDVVDWWKSQAERLPNIFPVAMRHLWLPVYRLLK